MVVAGAIAMKMGDALAAVPNAHTVAEGDEPMGNTPAQFAAYVKREIARWSTVVLAMGMRAG
jgi:tripartite-type tricarboxylate transporter receptor subunit TctC